MNAITKGEFLQMVKLQHLEVLTPEQMAQNTNTIKTYIEKASVEELTELEKATANTLIAEVGEFTCWNVLRDDFSKAVVYTRPEQVVWDEPVKGEFGEIIKAKGGIYKPTAENKKLGRVGQKYGEGKKDIFPKGDLTKEKEKYEADAASSRARDHFEKEGDENETPEKVKYDAIQKKYDDAVARGDYAAAERYANAHAVQGALVREEWDKHHLKSGVSKPGNREAYDEMTRYGHIPIIGDEKDSNYYPDIDYSKHLADAERKYGKGNYTHDKSGNKRK
jgi:hypothetical protein